MKERPIRLTDTEASAILAGRKTQTRRPVKFRDCVDDSSLHNVWLSWDGSKHHWQDGDDDLPCPFGVPGDRLWVREAWAHVTECGHYNHLHGNDVKVIYRADDGCTPDRWHPSIHMPRWASRLTLEITDVRVERLSDISEADAIAEGCEPRPESKPWWMYVTRSGGSYETSRDVPQDDDDPFHDWVFRQQRTMPAVPASDVFRDLWQSLNWKRPGCDWAANPWVWVVEFRRVQA